MTTIPIMIQQRKCRHQEITIWKEIMTPKRNQNSNKLSKLKALQRHLDQKDIFAMWNRPVFISMAAYLRIEFKISPTSSLHYK